MADQLDRAPDRDGYYATDNVELTTVGIDVGSSTSHLVFSRIHLQRLGQYLSSRYVVVRRETLHASPILLTPYAPDNTIDVHRLATFVRQSYDGAGLRPDMVDTGAIILTGEAVKRTNAREIAELVASEAGKFVCASAGPNLETILAAHGSGAVALARQSGKTILNVDLGGGTAKLALIRQGHIAEIAAINVGSRLVAFDRHDRVTRIEPAARLVAAMIGITLDLGAVLAARDRTRLADVLAACLLELMSGTDLSPLAERLMITGRLQHDVTPDLVTFSGGVSEYLYGNEVREFGDLGASLAAGIGRGAAALGIPVSASSPGQRIRATVIGASQFTIQLSGNTVAVSRASALPVRNLQVLTPRLPRQGDLQDTDVAEAVRQSFQRFDLEEGENPVALSIRWGGPPFYLALRRLADGIARAMPRSLEAALPVILIFSSDIGRLVGNILQRELGVKSEVISLDSIDVGDLDFIDIGEEIHPARVVPVVVKSLVFPESASDVGQVSATAAASVSSEPGYAQPEVRSERAIS